MIAPFGTWESPLTAVAVAAGSLRLEVVAVHGDEVYWLEGRPAEGGRTVLVRRRADGSVADVTPGGTNVRTRVHEYGGGACVVWAGPAAGPAAGPVKSTAAGTVYYSEFADQRVYRLVPGASPVPITPAGPWRYADAAIHPSGRWLVCVREDHTQPGREPVTTLVRLPLDGQGSTGESAGVSAEVSAGDVLASGFDFYSTPRFSADDTRLCWLAWRHPQMPWDGTEVWVADIAGDGSAVAVLRDAHKVAGGSDESIVQPGWSPDGTLYFVSDRTGWWNLYRLRAGAIETIHPMEAELGGPQWQFGASCWAFADPSTIVVSYSSAGRRRAATIDLSIDPKDRALSPLGDLEPGAAILATRTHAVFVGGSPRAPDAVVRVSLSSRVVETLRVASPQMLQASQVSEAQPIEFPTDAGLTAHAFYYAPRSAAHTGLTGERPPLIVISHGGPTSAATTRLSLEVQYWTTRGFGIVDVDYGGSSGYGRAYRQRLNGQWGIVDVRDCVNAANHLVREGLADRARLIIRGRSAGGYTTLAALTFHPDVFTAGASYYGICDVEVLARDTHKFESRYLDTLIGPYPAARDDYRARSPIHFTDRLSCPLILLQGLEDQVVPPNQAEMMADAVRAKGLPVALLLFEGEQHGFRRTETIVRCLEAELSFYGAVCGFEPVGSISPVRVDNLERWKGRLR